MSKKMSTEEIRGKVKDITKEIFELEATIKPIKSQISKLKVMRRSFMNIVYVRIWNEKNEAKK